MKLFAVRKTRKTVWSCNIVRDVCLPCSIDATSVGMRAGIWFPVTADQRVFGVCELLARQLDPPNDAVIANVERLGQTLGTAIRAVS